MPIAVNILVHFFDLLKKNEHFIKEKGGFQA